MTVTPRLANAALRPVSSCPGLAKRKALSWSVNVFATKGIIGDSIFTSPAGDRTAFYVVIRATGRSSR